MVLAKPEDKHVLKAFDLTGKVAAVSGMISPPPASSSINHHQEVLAESDSKYLKL